MQAFLTGSRVYGKPTEKSDVDLVIRCDQSMKFLLWTLSDLYEGDDVELELDDEDYDDEEEEDDDEDDFWEEVLKPTKKKCGGVKKSLFDGWAEQAAPPKPQIIRFGNLNIICCTSDDEYAVWKLGTSYMEKKKWRTRKPISKERATKIFRKFGKPVDVWCKGSSPDA